MSLQVFLQAQLLGAESFLAAHSSGSSDATSDFIGRSAWLSLLCEVLPRALLSELKLSRMLLGSSSAEQFLLVLAEEEIGRANEFLSTAAADVARLSGNTLRLVWVSTENLGAWPIARKRLDDGLLAQTSSPLAAISDVPAFFKPDSEISDDSIAGAYFATFAAGLASASAIAWSADAPARLRWNEGQYSWTLREQSSSEDDGIPFARRFATDEYDNRLASLTELGARSEGAPQWGILRGDVDHFDLRLRRAASIEEHIHLSVLFKEFFAGEVALLCTLPEFWRKVGILYRGGDDFAVVGAWDALILFARELHRLFERFAEQNLASFAGIEGKTITMALSIASDPDAPLAATFEEAGANLRIAKTNEPGSLHLFGRTLEWKRLADAEELKSSLVRLVNDFGHGGDYINDLVSVYRESFSARALRRGKAGRVEKPWRTYMRVSQVIPQVRGREAGNLRNIIVTHLLGKRTAGLKLRPSARVGLEWARLAAGVQQN